ncbi:hypothetical protein [Micromonospora hortensis]|uniref:hypothetical protein n=1 Tax=Micromonospora hortensis TaxID=2911209 RepID=UPI001EE807CA|nr:hypothetical protein [Micromonospora hortensis]MCG5450965.1 hypothetical protein [Micromonospora hortensis]
MTESKKPLWPHASVFVLVDEQGKVVVSFDRSPDSQKESLELPHQADRLVALHTAVMKAARALTGATSDEEAVPRLLEYAKEERGEAPPASNCRPNAAVRLLAGESSEEPRARVSGGVGQQSSGNP